MRKFKCEICGFRFSTDKAIARATSVIHPINPKTAKKCGGKMVEVIPVPEIENSMV